MPPRLYLVFDYMHFDLKQCLDQHFPTGVLPRPESALETLFPI